jgi:hypothetical protein
MPDSTFAEIAQLVRETDVELPSESYRSANRLLTADLTWVAATGEFFSRQAASLRGGPSSWPLGFTTAIGAAYASDEETGIRQVPGVRRLHGEGHDWPQWSPGLASAGTAGSAILVGSPGKMRAPWPWRTAPGRGAFGIDATASGAISTASGGEGSAHPRWLQDTVGRMNELLRLRPGWDTYVARPVARRNVQGALHFLLRVMAADTPSPTIVPVSDGGVQLEWHREGLDVEVLFSGEEDDGLYCHDVATGQEWEGPPVEGFIELDLARRLRSSGEAATL